MKVNYGFSILSLFATIIIWTSITLAAELVWRPINPSFGGNPYNSSWLLAAANAQNKFLDKQSSYAYTKKNPVEDFKDNLNRQILNRLANKIIYSAFGEEELEPGQFVVGDYVIDISSDNTTIKIVIQDPTSGSETSLEIPYYSN